MSYTGRVGKPRMRFMVGMATRGDVGYAIGYGIKCTGRACVHLTSR